MRIIAASAPLRRSPQRRRAARDRGALWRSHHGLRRARWLGLGATRARPLCRLSSECGARAACRANPSGGGAAHARLSRPDYQGAAAHGAIARRAADDRRPRGRLRSLAGRSLPLVAPFGGSGRARAGRGRGRRAFSRDALSLGRPDLGRHRLLWPGSGGVDGGRGRVAARQRHAGGDAWASPSRSTTRPRRLRAAIWCSGRAMSASCAIPSRCFTPMAGT